MSLLNAFVSIFTPKPDPELHLTKEYLKLYRTWQAMYEVIEDRHPELMEDERIQQAFTDVSFATFVGEAEGPMSELKVVHDTFEKHKDVVVSE